MGSGGRFDDIFLVSDCVTILLSIRISSSICAHHHQERGFFSNTAKKINRHAIASLKSGKLAGILVSSVNLALEDLASVKNEAIRSGLGLTPNVAESTKCMAFLDAEVREKGEVGGNGGNRESKELIGKGRQALQLYGYSTCVGKLTDCKLRRKRNNRFKLSF